MSEIADSGERSGRHECTGSCVVLLGSHKRARTEKWRIRASIARVVASVDDQRGAEVRHPLVKVLVSCPRVIGSKTKSRGIDPGQQQPIDLGAACYHRKISDFKSLGIQAPFEISWRRGRRLTQCQPHGGRKSGIVGFDAYPKCAAVAEEHVKSKRPVEDPDATYRQCKRGGPRDQRTP